jgi:hypothetical protein
MHQRFQSENMCHLGHWVNINCFQQLGICYKICRIFEVYDEHNAMVQRVSMASEVQG